MSGLVELVPSRALCIAMDKTPELRSAFGSSYAVWNHRPRLVYGPLAAAPNQEYVPARWDRVPWPRQVITDNTVDPTSPDKVIAAPMAQEMLGVLRALGRGPTTGAPGCGKIASVSSWLLWVEELKDGQVKERWSYDLVSSDDLARACLRMVE